jgi:hypothetical protein
MIPGPELAAWLADAAAHERTFDRIDACARRWSAHPLIADLNREVKAPENGTAAALLDATRRFLDRRDEIHTWLRDLIAECRADPFFRPPFQAIRTEIHTSLVLYHHPLLSISLGATGIDGLAAKKTLGRGAGSINFTGFVSLMRFIDAGGATFSFWEVPELTDTFTAATAGECRLVERRRIADGEELVIDGRRQTFVIDHAERDMVYFQAVIRADRAPVSVEYDMQSGTFVGASSTGDASSRVQLMASLLRSMDRTDALPSLAELLGDSEFHTRWHLMREMLAMDAEFALPLLKSMAAGDPNPDVRATAAATLTQFFPDEAADISDEAEAIECRA